MSYKILADIVVIIHFLWIVFLIFGAFLGVKYKAVKIFHISGLIFAFIIQIFDWYCPLTHLEVWLRSKHNPDLAYAGSFIAYYIERIVYIDIPPYMIFILTVFMCIFNAWFYSRKKRSSNSATK